jgi:hypothetical protein
VADARLWASTLAELGFASPRVLTDGAATRAGILAELRTLVGSSRAGDVVVFQYAGHGVQFNDRGSDEKDHKDEALAPVDLDVAGPILDDELFAIFSRLPEGVSLTCFFDCCHSGTNSRFLLQNYLEEAGRKPATDVAVRFIDTSAELYTAYHRVRATLPRGARTQEDMRWVSFAACQDQELAQESDGQGEFTRRAVPLLRGAISQRISNEEFQRRVTAAFRNGPRQNPLLDARRAARHLPLLTPAAGARDETVHAGGNGHGTGNGNGNGNGNGTAEGDGHGRITISIPVDTSTVDVTRLRVLVDPAEQL